MFETRTGTKIDEEVIVEVMTRERAGVWCLDVTTGKVVPDVGITCAKIPVISDEEIEKEMRMFIDTFSLWVDDDSDKRIAELLSALTSNVCVYADAIRILESDDSWMSGWREWISTAVWDELRAWLRSLDNGIIEVVVFDCSCVRCHDMAEHVAKDLRVRVEWNFDTMCKQEN